MRRLQQPQASSTLLNANGLEGSHEPSTSQRTNYKEPKLSLLETFNGNRSKFRGFANQVQLLIFMQPLCYPTPTSQVGLIGTLLSGMALNSFSPILEKNSPLLYDFEGFMKDFAACFGVVDLKINP
jgi:hypothetical protein